MINRVLAIALVVIVALTSFISTQSLTAKHYEDLSKYLKDQLKNASTPQEVHYAVTSLLKLGGGELEPSLVSSLCEKVNKNIAKVNTFSADDLYHTAAAQLALKCTIPNEQKFVEDFEKRLESILVDLSIKPISDLSQVYSATRALLLFKRKLKSIPTNNTLLNKVFNNISGRYTDDTGAFCNKSSSAEKCLTDTGYAYESLTILQSMISDRTKLLPNLVKISKKAQDLIKQAANASAVKAASIFVRGLNKLATILPFSKRITRREVEDSATAFQRAANDKLSLQNVYDLVEGLSAVSSSNIHIPISVSSIERNENEYSFRVTSPLGQPISDSVVKLRAVYPGSNQDDSLIGRPIEIKGDKGTYTWKDASGQIAESAGSYKFDIDVQIKGETTPYTRVFKTTSDKLDITDVNIVLSKLNERRVFVDEDSARLEKQGETLSRDISTSVKSGEQKKLIVSFNLKGIDAQQTFVRIGDEKRESTAVARKMGGAYRAEIVLDKIARDLSAPLQSVNPTGRYDVQLIVADNALQKPLLWTLAKINLDYQINVKPDEEGRHYDRQKEIVHKFNEPAVRASAGIASIFSLVVLAPVAVFALGLLAIGFNFNNCPSGLAGLLAPVFTASVAGMLAVIGWYFVEINIFTALKYLSLLGAVSVVTGAPVLSAISRRNVQGNALIQEGTK
ncbi:dolichyl-diphosphooligosaccharide-protein glycosyltransferase subunit 2 [Acrasis kona]|uniref:Dolichyl-diphosphooligosaccharide--protein glycosyltransferase subunit 2 n=1 Tax=Acrasis kona TaxID=1008807 RepID=A0AAW2YXX4_9EUKA